MSDKSYIDWTDATWNPVTGCTKISKGCVNCYAEKFAGRLKLMGNPKYKNGFKLSTHPEELLKPAKWIKPRMIFVNSMSDLFHEDLDPEFIKSVFRVMNENSRHIFQVLTKRSERLVEIADSLTWSPNIWMGVTVESSEYLYRMDHLLRTPAMTKFLSLEPLLSGLSEIENYFKESGMVNWVIVGGESGYNARRMSKRWAIEIKDICSRYGIPFFFKQWGAQEKGKILEGREWLQYPSQEQLPFCYA